MAAQEKREQKRLGRPGSGWLRSACGTKVVRITTIDPTAHAQWCEVVNAVRLWQNLLRQGWSQVPPQW